MLIHADAGAVGATATMLSAAALLVLRPRREAEAAPDADASDLLSSSHVHGADLAPSPGSILVPVRNPHLLAHLEAALRSPAGAEIVAMTVRRIGADAIDDTETTAPTEAERLLFSRVLAVAERYARPVRLLIVPARDVFDAIVSTVIRLQASEVYVGESATLSADDQARLLGEAWERAEHAGSADSPARHLPSQRPRRHLPPRRARADADVARLDLIHRIWLDAAKSVGPHVHHHDVVRAALTTWLNN